MLRVWDRASFLSKTISIDEKVIKFQIWDTAGQEKASGLLPFVPFRRVHLVLATLQFRLC